MKTFDIPLLPINLERNTDQKLNDRDVPGIELEYLWPKYKPRAIFTGAFVAGGTDGIAFSWCAEAPHNSLADDDSLEVFLQPAGSEDYYCWQIDPAGKCKASTATPSSWKSRAIWRQTMEDEFWYLELFIPWSDFGLKEQPAPGTIWRATLNRIDQSAKTARRRAPGTDDNPGYQTLLDGTDKPNFHQPAAFAEFTFR